MAQPVWITPAGSLGTIPEGVFWQMPLLANTATIGTATCTATSASNNRITCNSTAGLWPGLNVMFSGQVFGGVSTTVRYFVFEIINSTQFTICESEFSTSPIALTSGTGSMTAEFAQHVYYYLQAGELPLGIQLADNGLIVGIPKAVASISGVPYDVSRDVTSKFTVRAFTQRSVNNSLILDRIAERTFTLTVTGQDAPEFITPPGLIASYFDSTQVTDLQIEYTDVDPADSVVIKLSAGSLPPGLSISSTGLITGITEPVAPPEAQAGFSRDGQGYSEYAFDFSTQSFNYNYEFILEVTDGKTNGSNLRKFVIAIYSRDSLTADTTDFTADDTFITADGTPVRNPIILTPTGSIGRVRSDNFFAFQFEGYDANGNQLVYERGGDSIPGLTLDPTSGWLYGYIPDQGLLENTYDFTIRAYELVDPTNTSPTYNYTITLVGAIDTEIVWTSSAELGTINNGEVSIFEVHAINASGIPLEYRLKSGSTSSLPQGLTLLPSGHIAGRVSFDTFALDGGTTTFDVNSRNAGLTQPTTFDLKFTFVVEAYGQGSTQVKVDKTFSITVVREYNEPYENLYIQAMPPESDRALLQSLLQNQDIIPPEFIYRNDDPNFGRAQGVVYWHAYGLTSSTYSDYISSLYKNHYWKNLVLGSIETAQAVDSDGNVIYEVVYSRIIDDLVNSSGESVSKDVVIPYPLNPGQTTEIDIVYPNSLINMRDQVIDTVGKIADILPRWMLSKQSNGRVLGFTPSWVIAYTQPGKSGQIAYNIRTQFGTDQLNKIDFEVDRYELDRLLSKNWDPVTDQWVPHPAEVTSFDLQAHYQLPEPNDSSFVFVGGTGYAVGNQILIAGSDIGGTDGVNDVVVTVEEVDTLGTITEARAEGTSPLLSVGNTYTDVVGTNITGTGTGATWDLEVVGENPTVFDGNSLKFIDPVDMYSHSQEYDRYLVFPYRTIIQPGSANSLIRDWVNNNSEIIPWVNDSGNDVNWVDSIE